MRQQAKEEALRDAQKLSLGDALDFFKELDEQALAAAYTREHPEALADGFISGNTLKKIIAWLKEAYPQEVILLHRDSYEKSPKSTQSKYYPSAIHALKACIKIETENDTSSWYIEENVPYMKKLLAKHERKYKFVELFFKTFDAMA